MMKKNRLASDYPFDFELIGIVSSVKEYKLAWHLNQLPEFHLIKAEDVKIEFSDKLKVGKLDVDANQTSAAQQNVMSIPTLAIFKGGELVAQQVGALSKTQLKEFIESNI